MCAAELVEDPLCVRPKRLLEEREEVREEAGVEEGVGYRGSL